MCLGNHDYGTDTIGVGNSIHQINYTKKSKSDGKKWIMDDYYYTFKKGNVEFFVLDTNFDQYVLEPKVVRDQNELYGKKINDSKANGKLYMDTIPGLVLVNMVEKKNQLKIYGRIIKKV